MTTQITNNSTNNTSAYNQSAISLNQLDIVDPAANNNFPLNTTLYIWNMDSGAADGVGASYTGGKYGSQDLTVQGTALSSGNDALDGSVFCAFPSTAWLNNTNAVFNSTGDFSLAFWVFETSWLIGGTVISRKAAAGPNGWKFYNPGSGIFTFEEDSGGITGTHTVNLSNLAASTWHHIAICRKGGTRLAIYVDGVLAKLDGGVGAITAGGDLEVGSDTVGNNIFTGRIDEVVFDSSHYWSEDTVRSVYNRTARQFSVWNNTSSTKNVSFPINPIYNQYATLASTNNAGAVNIADYSPVSLIAPIAGVYLVKGRVNGTMGTGTGEAIAKIKFSATGGTYAGGTQISYSDTGGIAATAGQFSLEVSANIRLQQYDVVYLGIAVTAGAGNRIVTGDNTQTGATNLSLIRLS